MHLVAISFLLNFFATLPGPDFATEAGDVNQMYLPPVELTQCILHILLQPICIFCTNLTVAAGPAYCHNRLTAARTASRAVTSAADCYSRRFGRTWFVVPQAIQVAPRGRNSWKLGRRSVGIRSTVLTVGIHIHNTSIHAFFCFFEELKPKFCQVSRFLRKREQY